MKCTTEEFIQKARSIHGKKYDYSKVEYINSKTKVCIICPEHGEFWQRPNNHLNGHGCPKCTNNQRSNSKEFVSKARLIHGNKYDYSKVEYKNVQTKVCIICSKHGEFWQTPHNHLKGNGCPKCGLYEAHDIFKLKVEEFIKRANIIHCNKYDYSKTNYINRRTKLCIICKEHGEFLQSPDDHLGGHGCPKCGRKNSIDGSIKFYNSNSESFIIKARKIYGNRYDYSKIKYDGAHVKICIVCPEHGEFWQKPNNHLNGHGCPKCGKNSSITKNSLTTNQFIEKAIKIHGNKYDYSKVNYEKTNKKVCIVCPEHGNFYQIPCNHLHGAGCPLCNESHGEREIRKWLDEHNIEYIREKEFNGL